MRCSAAKLCVMGIAVKFSEMHSCAVLCHAVRCCAMLCDAVLVKIWYKITRKEKNYIKDKIVLNVHIMTYSNLLNIVFDIWNLWACILKSHLQNNYSWWVIPSRKGHQLKPVFYSKKRFFEVLLPNFQEWTGMYVHIICVV